MADTRTITLRQGHGTASTIILRALPVPDPVTTTIVLYGLHATPATIILRNPLTIPEGGGGPTIIESTASSSGSATASGDSCAIWHVEAVSAGAATASGLAAAVFGAIGSSDGAAVCLGESETILAGPPPAGTVPIRYIVGETANVVPVVTVLVWDFGVVSVREYVGPAHVVPVREVTTEYPHTKIIKV